MRNGIYMEKASLLLIFKVKVKLKRKFLEKKNPKDKETSDPAFGR